MKSELLRAKLRGEVSQADYQQANLEFNSEIAVLEEQLQVAQVSRLELDAFLRFANVMLVGVASAWQRADADQRGRVQNLLFQKRFEVLRRTWEILSTLTLACSARWKR
jgi:hypothetical protein